MAKTKTKAKAKPKTKAKKSTKAKATKAKGKTRPSADGEADFYKRMAEQKQEASSGRVGGKAWKPGKSDEKTENVRFFAYQSETTGRKELAHRRAIHWVENPEDSDDTLGLTCPGPETCPICDLEEHVSEGTWRDISPRVDYAVNCIVQDKDGSWFQPSYAKVQPSVWSRILEAVEADPELKKAFEFNKGRVWRITNNGKSGMKIRYTGIQASVKEFGEPPIDVELRDIAGMIREPDMDALEAVAAEYQ